MGIPPDELGNLRGATRDEIGQLGTAGLEVEIDEVVQLPDGTLSYKDRRVLLYIRDTSQYRDDYSDPRFHIADCFTLRQMRENGRSSRYVIANRDDGFFIVNFVNRNKQQDKRLYVCQHCLERLNYKGFRAGMSKGSKSQAVKKFLITDFFAAYPKTLHHSIPTHDELTAPLNDYTQDFSRISLAYRERRKWTCESCEIQLSKPDMQALLARASYQRAKE